MHNLEITDTEVSKKSSFQFQEWIQTWCEDKQYHSSFDEEEMSKCEWSLCHDLVVP